MRRFVLLLSSLALLTGGCVRSSPPRSVALQGLPEPHRSATESTPTLRAALLVEISRVEAALRKAPSSRGLQRRLSLTVAIARVDPAQKITRPDDADKAISAARTAIKRAIEQAERVRAEIEIRREEKKRALPARPPRIESADHPKTAKKKCSPGDPSCGLPAEVAPPSPPPPRGAIDPEKPRAPGAARVAASGAASGVMAAVDERLAQMEACIPAHMDSQLQISVRVRLDKSGGFREPRVRADGLSTAMRSCLVDVLSRVRIPKHNGGSQLLSFQLSLGGEA